MSIQQSIPASAAERAQLAAALEAAQLASATGDVPVGAAIFDGLGNLIATGYNTREAELDIAGHAEIRAINAAIAVRGDKVLDDCTLAVTLEPCVMCAGAILAARLKRVVFGAWDDKAGAAGSVYDLLRDGRLPHPTPEVVGGVNAQECALLLTEFFADKRR